jgi:hypothetical protein
VAVKALSKRYSSRRRTSSREDAEWSGAFGSGLAVRAAIGRLCTPTTFALPQAELSFDDAS